MVSLQRKCVWISIAPSMSDTYSIKKLGGDKIALLGLLVLALLTARLVVGIRSALVLSEPIPLPRAGISVSVPIGNGWQSAGHWSYRDDAYILTSSFLAGTGEATAWVLCRYMVTAETTAPQERFDREADEVGGDVVEIDEIRTDTLIFVWARIEVRESPQTMFMGTAILPGDRQLDITVIEITGDAEQAESAFKGVVESANLDSGPGMAALDKT